MIKGQTGAETFGVCAAPNAATHPAISKRKNTDNDAHSCFDYAAGVAINDTASITDPEL
jgi:hypothetical protein